MRFALARVRMFAVLAGCLTVFGCTNNPYPEADRDKKVLYSSFNEAPKTLDPAVAYTTAEHVITGNVYDTLLEYHYLERPYRLIAGLAAAVPEPQQLPDGSRPTASRSARASSSTPIPASRSTRPGGRRGRWSPPTSPSRWRASPTPR